MDTSKTPETMAAAFDHWRQMNAVLPTMTDTLNDRMCDLIASAPSRDHHRGPGLSERHRRASTDP